MNKKLISALLALGLLLTSVASHAQQNDAGAPDRKKGNRTHE